MATPLEPELFGLSSDDAVDPTLSGTGYARAHAIATAVLR